jgi:hypothetical protein
MIGLVLMFGMSGNLNLMQIKCINTMRETIGICSFLLIATLIFVTVRGTNDTKYEIMVRTNYNDGGVRGQMYHKAKKVGTGKYFIKYDSLLSANTGVEGVEVEIWADK